MDGRHFFSIEKTEKMEFGARSTFILKNNQHRILVYDYAVSVKWWSLDFSGLHSPNISYALSRISFFSTYIVEVWLSTFGSFSDHTLETSGKKGWSFLRMLLLRIDRYSSVAEIWGHDHPDTLPILRYLKKLFLLQTSKPNPIYFQEFSVTVLGAKVYERLIS